MERLRFDPYASANCGSRHIGYTADNHRESRQRASEACPCNNASPVAAAAPTAQTNLAQAFIIPQASIYPQYEVCEGWRKGTLFVSLDKPLEGVTPCGRR